MTFYLDQKNFDFKQQSLSLTKKMPKLFEIAISNNFFSVRDGFQVSIYTNSIIYSYLNILI